MPEQMFMLVDDIERYPEFLPWCTGATVLSRDPEVTRASLHVGFRGIKQSFSTENRNTPPHEIALKLIDGPFRALDGRWRFNDLGGKGCKIEFNLASNSDKDAEYGITVFKGTRNAYFFLSRGPSDEGTAAG